MTQLLGPAVRYEFDDELRLTRGNLLSLFGACLTRRLTEGSNPHNTLGAHYNGNHHHAGRRNPAGSKLMRSFIRANGPRSENWKPAYLQLTGREYDHINTPEVEDEPIAEQAEKPAPKIELSTDVPAAKAAKPGIIRRAVSAAIRRARGRG